MHNISYVVFSTRDVLNAGWGHHYFSQSNLFWLLIAIKNYGMLLCSSESFIQIQSDDWFKYVWKDEALEYVYKSM